MTTGSFQTKTEQETADIAAELATSVQSNDVILLSGPLGAGKSVFARSLIRTLADKEEQDIPSPTFTLVQEYQTQAGPLWHFDLYRIEDPEEIYELGWEDIAGQELAVIEWPEKLGFLRPTAYIEVTIQPQDGTNRTINITRMGG